MVLSASVTSSEGVSVSDDFAAYVAARGPAMLRFAFVLTGDAVDAEDVVQDVLARALPRWSQISSAQDVDAYVRRMVVNAHVSLWRRFRRRESPVASVHDQDGGTVLDASNVVLTGIDDDRIWSACSGLSREQRIAVVLRFYEGLSYAEIATVVGCAEATARSRVFRGLTLLRDLLGEEEA
jgi:RNA polymerase sigma-70 factor (sigma-E family)